MNSTQTSSKTSTMTASVLALTTLGLVAFMALTSGTAHAWNSENYAEQLIRKAAQATKESKETRQKVVLVDKAGNTKEVKAPAKIAPMKEAQGGPGRRW